MGASCRCWRRLQYCGSFMQTNESQQVRKCQGAQPGEASRAMTMGGRKCCRTPTTLHRLLAELMLYRPMTSMQRRRHKLSSGTLATMLACCRSARLSCKHPRIALFRHTLRLAAVTKRMVPRRGRLSDPWSGRSAVKPLNNPGNLSLSAPPYIGRLGG